MIPPKKNTKKRKKRRGGQSREYEALAPMALYVVGGCADESLGDEWADDLPPRRVAEVLDHGDASGGAPPRPAAVPPSPVRVLAKHPSRERSPRRAASLAGPPLVAGCLATVRGLDVRADLNGSEVLLHELDMSSQRWRAETADGEVVRVMAERLHFHSPP